MQFVLLGTSSFEMSPDILGKQITGLGMIDLSAQRSGLDIDCILK